MEARKPSHQGVNARTADTRLRNANPRRAHLRSLATQALCRFLAIVALLTLPMQVQAQTTIWSSTLTVKTLATSSFGCNLIATNRCSTYLSDNDFTYDRTTFTIQAIFIYPPDSLRISLNNGLPAAAESLTLNIDGTNFAFEDRGYHSDDSVILWNNTGLSWTAGDTVSLTLMDPNRRPGTPEIPPAPWVGATEGSNGSLDVGWLEPALAGHFVKYYLRYRQEGYVPWTDGPQNITSTFGKITGLRGGTTYEVQVLASNNNGDSDWSPSGTGQTDSGIRTRRPLPPSPPPPTGENRIDLNWTAPSSEGGTIPSNPGEPDNEMEDDRIRSYKIEVRSAASNWLVLDRTIGSTDTVYSHRDVPAGVIRCYRVSATNTAGTGPPSNEAVATTDGAEGTCDRPPTPDPPMQQSQTPLAASFVAVPASTRRRDTLLAGTHLRRAPSAGLETAAPGAARRDRRTGVEIPAEGRAARPLADPGRSILTERGGGDARAVAALRRIWRGLHRRRAHVHDRPRDTNPGPRERQQLVGRLGRNRSHTGSGATTGGHRAPRSVAGAARLAPGTERPSPARRLEKKMTRHQELNATGASV